MILKKKKAITPGLRHQLLSDKTILYKKAPIKSLLNRLKKSGGRNNNGHISVRHRGGGSRSLYRQIDWNTKNLQCIVLGIEYDPNRTSLIARVFDLESKKYKYIVANKYLYPGSKIQSANTPIDIRIGNKLPLLYIPAGSILSAVGSNLKGDSLYARAAGTSCQLLQKGPIVSKIRIPSGKVIYIKSNSLATIGSISNDTHNLQVIGKAGKSRLAGWRPRVRGVAMNPVDHPHGGAGGKPSVTPWGRPTKGQPTVKKKNK
jgi:large subunit ribosomal protein L2